MPRVEIPSFTGGLVTRVSDEDLKPNQLTDALNIDVSKTIGATETRRGLELWDSLSFLSDMNIFYQNIFASSGLVIRSGTKLYVGTDVVSESMVDAKTIFEVFDNWLVMVNGTENLKYKDTGMDLRWNTGFTYSWEVNYRITSMYAAIRRTKLSSNTNYVCCFKWEVEYIDGDTPTGDSNFFYTSSCEVGMGTTYSDSDDILYLDCEETTGVDFISKTKKGFVLNPQSDQLTSDTKLYLDFDVSPFVDGSLSGHSVTSYGGGTQRDTTNKMLGESSAFFDGTGNFLVIPDSDDFYFGSNDFTIDFWIRLKNTQSIVFKQKADINNVLSFYVGTMFCDFISKLGGVIQQNFTWTVSNVPPSTIEIDVWSHIAFVRHGNLWTLYVNGKNEGTKINSNDYPNISANFDIGVLPPDFFSGNLDHFRITKGKALWTSAFYPNVPIDKLYRGNIEHSASQKKFGSQAMRFFNNGGRAISGGSSNYYIGNSDFTHSFFIYFTEKTKDQHIFYQRDYRNGFEFLYDHTQKKLIYRTYLNRFTFDITYDLDPTLNTWYHIAIIRGWGGNNNYTIICVNGLGGTIAQSRGLPTTTPDFVLGGGSGFDFLGYIDEYRFVKKALWTSDFTPPTTEYSPPISTVDNFDLNQPVKLGITPPSSKCSVADSGTPGNPNGTYSYKVTFMSGRGSESNASEASSDVTVSTNKINVSAIPISDDPQVTQRRLYRTLAGGSSYKFLCTINNNFDTTYVDDIDDSALGSTLDTNNDIPKIFSFVKEHQGLLYGVEQAQENRIWWNNQFDKIDSFKSSNYETFGTGEAVSYAIKTFGKFLLVLQQYNLWTYDTSAAIEVKERAFTDQGILGSFSAKTLGDGILYANSIGMFLYTSVAYDTLRSVPLHGKIGDIFDSESNNPNRVDPDYISNLCIGSLGNDILLSYTRQGQTSNDMTIHYNKETKRFETLIDKGFVCFTTDKNGKVLYGGSTDGYIYKIFSGNSDNGTDISWSITTKNFSREFGSFIAKKQSGWFFLDCNPASNSLNIEVYYDGTLVKTFTTNEASRYILRKKLPVPNFWYRVKFKLSGSGKQYIYGLAFDAELAKRKEIINEVQR